MLPPLTLPVTCRDEDDDLDDMEASFSQMQKEERISAKIGLQEDLEDMKREEEEKRLKMMRLKQAKKARRWGDAISASVFVCVFVCVHVVI